MKEKSYTRLEDFLEDASLIAWVQQGDPEAALFWYDWMQKYPNKVELLETAKDIIKGIQVKPEYVPAKKVEKEFDRLQKRILSQGKTDANPVLVLKPKYHSIKTMRWAAGLAFLFLSGIFTYQYYQTTQVLYTTDYGERMEIELDEGTLLSLNAHSQLYYIRGNPRKIWLEGEAFFTVSEKTGAASIFQVITPDLTVEVYGTEFNVNSHKEQTQVVLEEGSVKLELKNGERKEMIPGELLTYSASQNRIVDEAKLKRLETLTSWKDGTLIFEDISLQVAMEKIGELYGLEIEFEDIEMANEQIYLAVPTDNVEICIQAMEQSANMQIDMIENLLKISRSEN